MFAVCGLAIFLLIAHWTSRVITDAEFHKDILLLNEIARKFSSDLPSYYTRPESFPELRAAVVNLGTRRIYSLLLEKTGRVIAVGPATGTEDRAIEFVQQIGSDNLNKSGGYFNLGDISYVWTSVGVPGTSYTLLLVHTTEQSQNWPWIWLTSSKLWPLLIAAIALAAWLGSRFSVLVERLDQLQGTLKNQLLYDPLTGMPNRTLFIDRVKQQISLGKRSGQTLAVCDVNLDKFRNINEFLGAEHGDQLLRLVGQRLKKAVRDSDTVAHFGGDQFLILLNNIDENQVLSVAQKVLASLQVSFEIGEHNLFVRGNVGIAHYPQHGDNEQLLLQHAAIALRVAKKASTDIIVYNKKHDEYSIKHLALVNDLHNAILQNKFELFFQPKIRMRDREVVSAEVLLRWNHPSHGYVPPDQFIPVAEQTGLIQPLTQWVLNTALRHSVELQAMGLPITLSINVSMYNLLENDFDSKIKDALSTWAVAPKFLELEITESAMMSNPARSKELLVMLDAFGLRLSVDDFGTGYSSLTYLRQLPVDELKIDKSFVLQMNRDENDAAIVRTVIGLAHDLGLQVVAEGVESATLLERLERLECDVVQGNYLCTPLAFDDFVAWMREQNASAPPEEQSGQASSVAT